jgi:hypothetical protein
MPGKQQDDTCAGADSETDLPISATNCAAARQGRAGAAAAQLRSKWNRLRNIPAVAPHMK